MIKNIIFLILLSTSVNVFAMTTTGAVSAATGGTGRGAAEPVDSILLNPSIISQINSKFFSANYNKDQWGLVITDNGKDALFPAALAFVRSETDAVNTQRLSLAFSYAIWQRLAIGANISLLEYNPQNVLGEPKFRQTTGDMGISYITNTYGFGFVTNKAFSSKTDLNDSLQVQQTIGLGAHYTYLNFLRVRGDIESAPENKTDRLVYMGGLETYVNDWVVIRLGYQNNNVLRKNYVTGGLGFAGPQFGLHYAYNSNVADKSDDKHSIDLGIPF